MRKLKDFIKMLTFYELIRGLLVTTKFLVKRKVTEEYPDFKPKIPYRHKGRLHVEIDACISCRLCEKACPEGCIKVFPPSKEQFKVDKRPLEFLLSQEHCLHCGLCMETCPTGAIHHSYEYELVVFNFKELLFNKETLPYNLIKKDYRWNYLENVPYIKKEKGE